MAEFTTETVDVDASLNEKISLILLKKSDTTLPVILPPSLRISKNETAETELTIKIKLTTRETSIIP